MIGFQQGLRSIGFVSELVNFVIVGKLEMTIINKWDSFFI